MEPVEARPPSSRPLTAVTVVGVLATATLGGWLTIDHAPGLDPVVVAVLWFNIGLVLVGIGLEVGRRPYSLNLLHLLSMFLFLGAASLLQYTGGVLGVPGPIHVVEDQILRAALATTLWLTGYIGAYELWRATRSGPPRRGFLSRPLNLTRVLPLTLLGMAGLVYLAALGLLGATTRGAATEAIVDSTMGAGAGQLTSPLFVINMNLARALPGVTLMAALLVFLRSPGGGRLLLLPIVAALGLGTLLTNNPFAASRMFFTCNAMAFSAPFILRHFKTGGLAVTAVLGGLAFLPAMGETRHALDFQELSSYFEMLSPITYLAKSSDVDSLGMTALCQEYVDRFGIRWGTQLAAAFLFWVPRVFWPSKPVGTGTEVTAALGYDFTNLSPPIQAEFLVNFGLPGVIVGGAIFGLILSRLDRNYWAAGRKGLGSSIRLIDAAYPFWLGCALYFTRGDFLPALVFTVSFTVWVAPLGFRVRDPARQPDAADGGGAAPEPYSDGLGSPAEGRGTGEPDHLPG